MKKTVIFKKLSLILCVVLIAAIALLASGCKDNSGSSSSPEGQAPSSQNETVTEVGEGSKSFSFTVVDGDKNKTEFLVKTDKKKVGEALLEVGLVEGDMGQYGLYVKKVNGIEADYDKDGTYWAFYVGEKMANAGVDMTDIVEGTKYSFRVSK